jgi:ribonuclease HI
MSAAPGAGAGQDRRGALVPDRRTREADWELVFDGGSLGNPGQGYGSYRLRPRGGAWLDPVRLDFGARVTNNEAEYGALIAGLEAIARGSADPAQIVVDVAGDSQLVIYHLTGIYKVRAGNLRGLFDAAWRAAACFAAVRYNWHPRSRSVDLLGH